MRTTPSFASPHLASSGHSLDPQSNQTLSSYQKLPGLILSNSQDLEFYSFYRLMLKCNMLKSLQEIKEVDPLLKEDSTAHIYNIFLGGNKSFYNSSIILPLKRNLLSIYSIPGPKQSVGTTDVNDRHSGCPLGVPSLVQRGRSGNKAFPPAVIGVKWT